MQGKKEGHVASLQEEMDLLRNQGGFWIHDALYERILDWENLSHKKKDQFNQSAEISSQKKSRVVFSLSYLWSWNGAATVV